MFPDFKILFPAVYSPMFRSVLRSILSAAYLGNNMVTMSRNRLHVPQFIAKQTNKKKKIRYLHLKSGYSRFSSYNWHALPHSPMGTWRRVGVWQPSLYHHYLPGHMQPAYMQCHYDCNEFGQVCAFRFSFYTFHSRTIIPVFMQICSNLRKRSNAGHG